MFHEYLRRLAIEGRETNRIQSPLDQQRVFSRSCEVGKSHRYAGVRRVVNLARLYRYETVQADQFRTVPEFFGNTVAEQQAAAAGRVAVLQFENHLAGRVDLRSNRAASWNGAPPTD